MLKPALKGLLSSLWAVFKKQALQSYWSWCARRAFLAEQPCDTGQAWSNAVHTEHPPRASQGLWQAQSLNSSKVSIHPVLPLFTMRCTDFHWLRRSYIALSKHWQGDNLFALQEQHCSVFATEAGTTDPAGHPASSQALPGSGGFFPPNC